MTFTCYNNCRRIKVFDNSSAKIDIILNMLHEYHNQLYNEMPTIIVFVGNQNYLKNKSDLLKEIDLINQWICANRNLRCDSLYLLFMKMPNDVYQKLILTLYHIMDNNIPPYLFVNKEDFLKLKRILMAVEVLVTTNRMSYIIL